MCAFKLKPTEGSKGIVYVAFGEEYDKAGAVSAHTVVNKCKLPVCVMTNLKPKLRSPDWPAGTQFVYFDLPDARNRHVRTTLIDHTPFEYTFHLDSDACVVHRKAAMPLDYLGNWDMVAVTYRTRLSGKPDWYDVRSELRTSRHYRYAGCAIYFKKNDTVKGFFQLWNKIWKEAGKARDMGPLYQAVWESNVRVLLLPGEDVWLSKKGQTYIWHTPRGTVPGMPPMTKFKPDGYNSAGKKVKWQKVVK